MGIWKITQLLRAQRLKAPKGRTWHDNTILRMLQNQVYLGKVVFGKTTGSGHKDRGREPDVRQNPEERWIIYDDAHEALITVEEFNDIQIKLMQNSRFPVHTKKSKQALSGLLFCKKCGRAMTCNRRKVKDGEKLYVKKCQSMSDTGVVCGNPGIQAQDVLDAIDKKVKAYRKQLDHNKNKKRDKALQLMQKQITAHKQSLKNLEDGFGRIRNMYRLGVISDEEFMKDIKKNKEELESTQNNLRSLEKQYQYTSAEGRKDLRDRFADFDENFSIESSNPEDVNNLLKTIIEKIFYIREGDDFVLDIKFMWDL